MSIKIELYISEKNFINTILSNIENATECKATIDKEIKKKIIKKVEENKETNEMIMKYVNDKEYIKQQINEILYHDVIYSLDLLRQEARDKLK